MHDTGVVFALQFAQLLQHLSLSCTPDVLALAPPAAPSEVGDSSPIPLRDPIDAAFAGGLAPPASTIMTMDLTTLGVFDVVLYLGVLYHMTEPLTALKRVRAVTREVAVIETVAVRILGHQGPGLMAFFVGNEVDGKDFGNWYAPSMAGLIALCKAAEFSRVEVREGPPKPWRERPRRIVFYRAAVLAWV